jgi:serine/threonine protein kinase
MSIETGRLTEAVRRFEQACASGDGVELAQFLPPLEDPLRTPVLHELIRADLEVHWRRGQPIRVEEYLARFPELGDARTVPATLIVAEFRARTLYGDRPALDVYQRRFPDQFPECERLARAGALLEMPTDVKAAEVARGEVTPSRNPLAPLPPPAKAPQVVGPQAPGQGKPSSVRLSNGYKLIERIGSGGFAEVVRGEAPGGFPCAVKIIFRPYDHDEAQRELHALETVMHIRHPYLLQTQASWVDEGKLYVAMELAEGSLRERLKACRKAGLSGIPVDELLRYFREAAEALDYLHSEHVQHRDLKPDNILVLRGHAKVADFGLARLQEREVTMSVTGSGTPAYMPPEAWAGKLHNNSDQYSLAVTYFELRLDRRPFTGASPAELMMAHLEAVPEMAPLGEPEQNVILRGMSRDPHERYSSCQDFVRALEAALVDEMGPPRTRDSAGDASARLASAPGRKASRASIGPTDKSIGAVGIGQARRANLSDTDIGRAPTAKGWRSQTPRGSLLWVGLLAVGIPLIGLLAVGMATHFGRVSSLDIEPPVPIVLPQGQHTKVAVTIKRRNLGEPVRLGIRGDLPEGLTVTEPRLRSGGDVLEIELFAAPGAKLGPAQLTLHAEAGRLERDVPFTVTIKESAVAWLPAGFEPVGDDIVLDGGKKYYARIDRVLEDGSHVPFVFIPKDQGGDPRGQGVPAFYIMVNKVSYKLFERFSKAEAGAVKHFAWAQMKWKGDYPVMSVTLPDAAEFARSLGGRLPTTDEWDKAAGLYDVPGGQRYPPPQDTGPYVSPWDRKDPTQLGISRKAGPLEAGKATHDIARSGCRDMAGNGREWTRSLVNSKQKEVWPLSREPVSGYDKFYLRGRTWRVVVEDEDHPLTFKDLDDKGYPESKSFDLPENDIGFRVVIEAPLR